MNAIAELVSQPTRKEFVERICAAWHKSREKIITLGRALIEAKEALAHGEFLAMVREDLPFGADNAQRFMRIARDPRISNAATSRLLPETAAAMDEFQKLNDPQFEHAIATGKIHDKLTVVEARQIVRDYIHVASKPHRPASAKCGAPVAPIGQHAHTWPEFVWLLVERRHAIGLSHLALDERIGWGEGQTSKYEIPHQDDGRIPTGPHLLDWLQGLGCALTLTPLV